MVDARSVGLAGKMSPCTNLLLHWCGSEVPLVSQYKVYRHEAWSHPILQYTEIVWDAHMLAALYMNEDIFGRASGPPGAEDDKCQVRSHVRIVNTVECQEQPNEGVC